MFLLLVSNFLSSSFIFSSSCSSPFPPLLLSPPPLPSSSPLFLPLLYRPIEMSGYLFKRGKNTFRSWSRRWFLLGNNKLVYQSESKAEVGVCVCVCVCVCDPLKKVVSSCLKSCIAEPPLRVGLVYLLVDTIFKHPQMHMSPALNDKLLTSCQAIAFQGMLSSCLYSSSEAYVWLEVTSSLWDEPEQTVFVSL